MGSSQPKGVFAEAERKTQIEMCFGRKSVSLSEN